MKLLIVEDDPNLSALWLDVFAAQGHMVVLVETPFDARKRLMTDCYDLVLIDLYIGTDSALMVAAMATYTNPGCKVVVIAGGSELRKAKICGSCSAVLHKPVDIEHLVAVCDHICIGTPTMRAASGGGLGLR